LSGAIGEKDKQYENLFLDSSLVALAL